MWCLEDRVNVRKVTSPNKVIVYFYKRDYEETVDFI
jgi:hypothetical protein